MEVVTTVEGFFAQVEAVATGERICEAVTTLECRYDSRTNLEVPSFILRFPYAGRGKPKDPTFRLQSRFNTGRGKPKGPEEESATAYGRSPLSSHTVGTSRLQGDLSRPAVPDRGGSGAPQYPLAQGAGRDF